MDLDRYLREHAERHDQLSSKHSKANDGYEHQHYRYKAHCSQLIADHVITMHMT